MIKEIQHKRRALLVMFFIVIPIFVGSLWLVIQMEFYGYVPKSSKTFAAYLSVIFMPIIGFLCYLGDKKELKMKLCLYQTAINFSTPTELKKIPINEVKFITLDTAREVCKFNMTQKIPLENHNIVELNVSNYDISFDSFVSLLQKHYSHLDVN